MIFRWVENERRYYNGRNQVITEHRVRTEVRKVIDKQTVRIETLSQRFVAGKISSEQWAAEMRSLIKPPHTQAAMTAHGGSKALQGKPKELGWLGAQLKKEYKFLDNFIREVESGKQAKNGQLVARAKMYAQKANSTFENAVRRREQAAGLTEEKNIFGDAKHCQGCLDETEKGWQPIGEGVPIGERDCLANDKCYLEFR